MSPALSKVIYQNIKRPTTVNYTDPTQVFSFNHFMPKSLKVNFDCQFIVNKPEDSVTSVKLGQKFGTDITITSLISELVA